MTNKHSFLILHTQVCKTSYHRNSKSSRNEVYGEVVYLDCMINPLLFQRENVAFSKICVTTARVCHCYMEPAQVTRHNLLDKQEFSFKAWIVSSLFEVPYLIRIWAKVQK